MELCSQSHKAKMALCRISMCPQEMKLGRETLTDHKTDRGSQLSAVNEREEPWHSMSTDVPHRSLEGK